MAPTIQRLRVLEREREGDEAEGDDALEWERERATHLRSREGERGSKATDFQWLQCQATGVSACRVRTPSPVSPLFFPVESGPLRAVHLSRLTWPGGLVN